MSIKIGLIGYGYWGPNLLRNFLAQPDAKVTMVSDLSADKLAKVRLANPGIKITTDADEVINSSDVDAIVISTPVFTHYPLAREAIMAGKHVLVEKPMTSSLEESEELIELAEQKNVTLMVDHTFLYNGAIIKAKKIIDNGDLGNLHYFDSSRINLGLFQPDVNVLWDLAPHDLSILFHLYKEKPMSVNSTGISHTGNNIENIAYLTVNYQSGFIAHFNCSWTSPVKIRTTLIGGDKKMMLYNDLESTEKIKIYDTGYSRKTESDQYRALIDYRVGDIYVPKLETTEALFGMAKDFLKSIHDKSTPLSSAQLGSDVVRILEASNISIKQNGKEVKL